MPDPLPPQLSVFILRLLMCVCLQDFSFVMREFRLFYIKMPNGRLHSEVVSVCLSYMYVCTCTVCVQLCMCVYTPVYMMYVYVQYMCV